MKALRPFTRSLQTVELHQRLNREALALFGQPAFGEALLMTVDGIESRAAVTAREGAAGNLEKRSLFGEQRGLVAEGVWSDGVFVELPPPSQADVEAVLARALQQLLPDFESRQAGWPQDEYEALQAKSAQLKLPLDDEPAPARKAMESSPPTRRSDNG